MDPLAMFWCHETVIDRWAGRSGYDDGTYTEAAGSTAGFVSDGLKISQGPDGDMVTSTARIAYPIGTAAIPLKSRITLPPDFGNRVTEVVDVAVAKGVPGAGMPEHVVVSVK